MHTKVKGNWFQKAILLNAAFHVGIKQSKNLLFAIEWIKEAYEIWSSILHPEGRFGFKAIKFYTFKIFYYLLTFQQSRYKTIVVKLHKLKVQDRLGLV